MTINKFRQQSFVTWTTGLKERIREAEKEIKMRKYRGLTKEGKWVYGWYLEKEDSHCNTYSVIVFGRHFEVIPETVGQQVGLKDKKRTEKYPEGQEIYERDILQLIYETLELCGVVQQTESGEWELYKDEGNHVGVHHNIDRVEIIGNIHQNPELLEQS